MRAVFFCALLGTLGCDTPQTPPPPPDGGPPLALDVLGESQLGLHFTKSATLRVRYHVEDATAQPITGQPVRFSIFGDPAGSTLSTDRAVTDDDGVAEVTLTAGAAETTFSVTASALNAPDTEFQIAIAELGFVGLRVQLEWSGATTLKAYLYNKRTCAELPPSPGAPPAYRSLAKPGSDVTLEFINLLSMTYAVLGRAEDASGHLLAQGCVDVPRPLVPAGSTVDVPLPLTAVVASPIGSFALTTDLTVSSATSGAATAPWHTLNGCPLGLAQALLDNTVDGLAPALQTAIANQRGAASGTPACRPAMKAAVSTLDNDLQMLLAAGPGAQVGSLTNTLDGIVASGSLSSTLTIKSAGPDVLTADHTLTSIDTGLLPAGSFDALGSGLPIISVKDVPITWDQGKLLIGAHGFTLRLPELWQATFEDGVLASKFPALVPPTTRGWLGLAVAAVTHGGMTGCPGVEDLICQKTGAASCTGNVAPACLAALDEIAAQLEAGFHASGDVDFTLSGSCDGADSDGDLVIDSLSAGVWQSPLAQTATFTGAKQ